MQKRTIKVSLTLSGFIDKQLSRVQKLDCGEQTQEQRFIDKQLSRVQKRTGFASHSIASFIDKQLSRVQKL